MSELIAVVEFDKSQKDRIKAATRAKDWDEAWGVATKGTGLGKVEASDSEKLVGVVTSEEVLRAVAISENALIVADPLLGSKDHLSTLMAHSAKESELELEDYESTAVDLIASKARRYKSFESIFLGLTSMAMVLAVLIGAKSTVDFARDGAVHAVNICVLVGLFLSVAIIPIFRKSATSSREATLAAADGLYAEFVAEKLSDEAKLSPIDGRYFLVRAPKAAYIISRRYPSRAAKVSAPKRGEKIRVSNTLKTSLKLSN